MLRRHGDPKEQQRSDFILSVLAASIFTIYWTAILTFPAFFLFNPFLIKDGLRKYELVLSLVGWLSLSSAVPALFLAFAAGYRKALDFVPICALIWPVGLIINHFTLYVRTKDAGLSYLSNYPIFFFTDVLLPVLVLFIWSRLRTYPREPMLETIFEI